jgi:hypothetical protein
MAVMLQPCWAETQNRRQMKEQPSEFFLVCGACGSNQGHGRCVSVKMLPAERKVQCVL